MSTESKAQFTRLFDNKTLSRLERMRLNPTRRLTVRSRGEHLAGKGGSSTEFSDFRDYVAGDDIRSVDWNIFARLNRPYVRLYRHEEEMHVVVIVDASSSMMFEAKLDRAKQIAGALGLMGLMNNEKVSVYSCNHLGKDPVFMPPSTGRLSMKRMFEFLEGIPGGGDFPADQAAEAVLRRHRGKGVAIFLSDFLTFGELSRPMNLLFSAGLEIFAVQVLAPSERNPEITGDLRYVDCETNETLDISSAGDLLGIYHEHREALERDIALMCRQRGGRFLSITSTDPLDWFLFDLLRRKGWVR